MDRSERFYLIRQRLGCQRSASTRQLLDELEVSPATLKRDIQYLRDRFQVPIEWNAELGGYTMAGLVQGVGKGEPGALKAIGHASLAALAAERAFSQRCSTVPAGRSASMVSGAGRTDCAWEVMVNLSRQSRRTNLRTNAGRRGRG